MKDVKKCPLCGGRTTVLETRKDSIGLFRIRGCCDTYQHQFKTYEVTEEELLKLKQKYYLGDIEKEELLTITVYSGKIRAAAEAIHAAMEIKKCTKDPFIFTFEDGRHSDVIIEETFDIDIQNKRRKQPTYVVSVRGVAK